MAVASLIIATLSAKSNDLGTAETGRDVREGNTVIHYGVPVFVPDLTSGGKWIAFPARTEKDPITNEQRYIIAYAHLITTQLWQQTPTVSLENGVVVGHGVAVFNHNGQAYSGVTIHRVEEDINIAANQQVLSNLPELQEEYKRNIKSGKWRSFVNGE